MEAQTIERQCQIITAFAVEEAGDNAARIERALIKARNQVGAAGGNALHLDSTVGNAYSHTFFVRALHCTGLPTTVTGPTAGQQASATLRITDRCAQSAYFTLDDRGLSPGQRDSLARHIPVTVPVAPGPHVLRVVRLDSTGAVAGILVEYTTAPGGGITNECRY
jgi:hypothetical protein